MILANVCIVRFGVGRCPRGPGWTYRHDAGFDGARCAFVLSWRLTPADTIRSRRRSKPWATASASQPYYWSPLLSFSSLKHSLAFEPMPPPIPALLSALKIWIHAPNVTSRPPDNASDAAQRRRAEKRRGEALHCRSDVDAVLFALSFYATVWNLQHCKHRQRSLKLNYVTSF